MESQDENIKEYPSIKKYSTHCEGISYTMRGHKRDKQVQMTWITRLELHCDAVTSGVPILLRLVTPTPGEGTQDT